MQQEASTGTVAIRAQRDIGPCASGFYTSGLGALCLLSRFSCVLPSADRLFVCVSVINASSSRPLTRRSSGRAFRSRGGLNACCLLKHVLGVLSSCFLNGDCWGFCGILGVLGYVVGCLPCPARLSAPVTLTLTLSRPAGEGISFIVGDGFDWRKRLWVKCVVFGLGGSGLEFPASAGIPRCPLGRFGLPRPLRFAKGAWPPLSFGHFPRERGKTSYPTPPLDSCFRRNDVRSARKGAAIPKGSRTFCFGCAVWCA